jgi:hypothetical protein
MEPARLGPARLRPAGRNAGAHGLADHGPRSHRDSCCPPLEETANSTACIKTDSFLHQLYGIETNVASDKLLVSERFPGFSQYHPEWHLEPTGNSTTRNQKTRKVECPVDRFVLFCNGDSGKNFVLSILRSSPGNISNPLKNLHL